MVTGGCNYALAQTSTGLYAWGLNNNGELGDQSTTNRLTPVIIPLLFRGQPPGKITGVFAGCDHTMIRFAKGLVMAWGDNTYGQLGDGTTTDSDKPVGVSIPSGDTITAVATSCEASYAQTSGHEVLAWGLNDIGQLGDGSTANSDVPVHVDLPDLTGGFTLGAGPNTDSAFALIGPVA
jgi:alpha-tubulin suppressor-like RCC1 family protein